MSLSVTVQSQLRKAMSDGEVDSTETAQMREAVRMHIPTMHEPGAEEKAEPS